MSTERPESAGPRSTERPGEKPAPDAAVPPVRSARAWLAPAVITVALAIGAALGRFIVAPRFSAATSTASTSDTANVAGGRAVEISNLVVNPAGAQGVRFIMTTVVFEVAEQAAEQALRARNNEVRDRIISVLGSRTLETLTMPGARDSLKLALAAAVVDLVPRGTAVRVFLPQYVIQ